MKAKRFLSFVEEFGSNPAYARYNFGRIEVCGDNPYGFADREIRFCTPRLDEFAAFREAWDFRDVTDAELAQVEADVNAKFNEHPGGA